MIRKDNSEVVLSARVQCGVWVKDGDLATRVVLEEDQERMHTSKVFKVNKPPKRPYAPNLVYYLSAEELVFEGKELRKDGYELVTPHYPELRGIVEEDGSMPSVRKEMKEYFDEDNGAETGDGLEKLFSEFYS